jgi:hypothetical protein
LSILEEDAPPDTEIRVGFSDHVQNFVWTSSGRKITQRHLLSSNGLNSAPQTEKQSNNIPEKVQDLLPSFPPTVALDHHPCENFSFSPPLMDRKHTGPRRKFTVFMNHALNVTDALNLTTVF